MIAVGFCTEKKPSPLIAMLVATVVAETVPWVVMVCCAKAVTPPATCLFGVGGVRDQILEGGVDALVAGGRGVRDVAGNVLQREGLRLQAADRGVQCVEDTHNIVSTFDPAASHRPWPQFAGDCRKRYAKMENRVISNDLNENAPVE